MPGRSNIYADYLSRYAVPPTHTKPLIISSSTKSFETPNIQHSCDIDSDIEEFHEVILPLSDQASIHNHHPTSAHSTSTNVDVTSPSSFGVTLHEQQDSRSSDGVTLHEQQDSRSSDDRETRPETDISNYNENNRINFDDAINLLFPPKFSGLNEKFRVKHLPSIEDILTGQRTDVALQPIIAFLEHGSLPDDTAAARKIIFQSEQYILSSDGLLLHIYSNRRAKATTILKQHVQITIPAQYTQTVIYAFHDDILHSGVNKLFLQIRADFFWNSLYRDCEEYVKTCHNCQLARNISIHTKVPTKSLDRASQPMESITIDHVGPLSHILQTNHRYILTIQCDFSRFLWAFPVQSQDGKTLVNLLFQLFCQYGFPKYLHSDNGSAFTADVTKSFFQTYSITHFRSSFHNPKSQARLERSHKTIGAILRMYPDSVHNWPDFLSPIRFGLNTTPRTELANFTPAELFFGRKFQPIATLHLRNQQALSRNPNYTAYMEQLNLKLKVITDTVKVAEKICQDANKSRLDKRTPITTFHQGQKVLYFQLPAQGTCSKLSPRFNQIFEIISIDPLYQTAQLRDSNSAILSKRVHLSKLKPYFERDHSTNNPNKLSAPSIDTKAPRQINHLPGQTTVVPNSSGKEISIQTPVTPSTTQPQLHLNTAPSSSQAPLVNPGNSSRDQQQQQQQPTVHSVQHNNLISFPRSLIPPTTDSLRRNARINNRPYATKYSNFRTPMPVVKRN